MKKHVMALSLILMFSGMSSVLAAVPQTVRFGTDPTYPPFEVRDNQGQLQGFDIDLTNEICKRMEVKCVYSDSDFDSLIPSLKAKKIDAVISSLSITEKRLREIAFSDKLYAANARLVALKGSTIVPTVDSLKGKNIGLLQGTTQEAYANKYWRPYGVSITPYANQDLVYQDLDAGRIDAAFQDETQAGSGFLKGPQGQKYAFAGPAIKDDSIFGVGTGIGLRKSDTELKTAIDKAFAEIRKDGTYDKLSKKYFDFNIYGE